VVYYTAVQPSRPDVSEESAQVVALRGKHVPDKIAHVAGPTDRLMVEAHYLEHPPGSGAPRLASAMGCYAGNGARRVSKDHRAVHQAPFGRLRAVVVLLARRQGGL
jgi:hypothetical protein